MKHSLLASALMVMTGAVIAQADTLYLNNGASVDGIVSERADGLYQVRIGERTVVYRPTEVRSIEPNDKDGTFDREAAAARWEAARKELQEETGLNAEQRARVDELLAQLGQEGAARIRARETLVELSRDIPVLQYLKVLSGESSPTLKPWLLEAMMLIAPQETLPLVRDALDDPYWSTRVKIIELLSEAGDKASIPQIARGLADNQIEVRIAAVYGLARLGAKESTPALIESLAHADLRMTNASRDALRALWRNELDEQRLTTVDEWNAFYAQHSESIAAPIQLAALEPLVDPEYQVSLE